MNDIEFETERLQIVIRINKEDQYSSRESIEELFWIRLYKQIDNIKDIDMYNRYKIGKQKVYNNYDKQKKEEYLTIITEMILYTNLDYVTDLNNTVERLKVGL
jgi:hypothetical protein